MMRTLRFAWFPLLLLTASWPWQRKGRVAVAQVNQVFGGKDIDEDEYFSFAAILRIDGSSYHCGAAVVGSRYVLSAQHCFDESEGLFFSLFQVQVGYLCDRAANCGRRTEVIPIKFAWDHPGGGDMTLLELHNAISIKKVKPAIPYLGKDLQPDQPVLRKGSKLMLVSAGREAALGPVNSHVQKLQLKSIKLNKCLRKTRNKALIKDTTICSTSKAGNPCVGDSGSPLFVKGQGQWRGRDVIVAIHNWGPRNCDDPKINKIPVGHFRVSDAAAMLRALICDGSYPEDWCPVGDDGEPSNQSDDEDRAKPVSGVTGIPVAGTMIQKVPLGMFGLSVSYDPTDGNRVAAGGGAVVRILDRTELELDSPAVVYQFPGVREGTLQTKYSRDGSMIATGGGITYNVQIWDALNFNGRGALYELGPHTDNIDALVWSHDDKSLFVAGEEHVVSHWEVSSETKIATFRGHEGGINGIDLHPDGTMLLTGSSDADIKIWDVETATEVRSWSGGHRGSVRSVAYSPDATKVVSGGNDGAVKVWDISEDDQQPSTIFTFSNFLGGHTHFVNTLLFTPDGNFVVSGSVDKTIKFWDIENGGRPVLELDYFEMNSVNQLEWIGHEGKDTLFLAAFSENSKASFVWEISLQKS